ncbi:hypothetical protein SDC9_163943 [bioreactor metagenome]|uniref:Uncharacterized protein n=1 Tax=bioreactor metagenome TaxID=1076179 RepID=A0A645FQ95_9ZZZZ
MEFLQNHWHCILPAAGILIGLLFMGRDKPQDKSNPKSHTDATENAPKIKP